MKNCQLYTVLLMVLALVGCSSPKHFYQGPELSADERVTIWSPTPMLNVKRINDMGITLGVLNLGDRVYAKQGKNTITAESKGDSTSWSSSGYTTTSTRVYRGTFSADLLAGHVYLLESTGGYLTLSDLGNTFTLPEDSLVNDDGYDEALEEARKIGTRVKLYK